MRDLVMAVHWLRHAMTHAREPTGGQAALLMYGFAWECLDRALLGHLKIDMDSEHQVKRYRCVSIMLRGATREMLLRLRSVGHG